MHKHTHERIAEIIAQKLKRPDLWCNLISTITVSSLASRKPKWRLTLKRGEGAWIEKL
jgi:hypothetical protein